jgi:hypothetical protein
MDEIVSERILRRIEKDVDDPAIRSFLRSILVSEYKHSEEDKWRFSADYEKLIKQYLKKDGDSHKN